VGAVRPWDESPTSERDGRDEVEPLVRGLRERGLQLVVKPHPMDAEARQHDGVLALTDEDLTSAGTSLYAVLGQARGLVTDYSSVWVDYLLLDRPMAFLVTDRDSYTRTLLPPDVLEWVPGELVDPEHQPFAEFLADLDSGGANGAPCRADVAARIGLNPTSTAADDLVTALTRRGVLSTARTSPA
jgi:CDP-glycerol glycerophosphotransferase